MAMHQAIFSFRRDPDAVRGRKVERALLRRVLGMARPYRGALDRLPGRGGRGGDRDGDPAAAAAGAARHRRPRQRTGPWCSSLAAGAVGLALAVAGLSLVQRWYSARIGEGLIYDMRIALFDHVQRLPLSFFTRTQTGALMSRHEQRRHRRAAGGHEHARHRGINVITWS